LESTNKVYGTHILMSEETKQMAERAIESREIDLIAVKGKSEWVRVYELISLQGKLPPDWEEKRLRFSEGINAYRQQDWSNAKSIFQELEQKYADGPSVAFLERINQLEKLPKNINWDGTWQMTTK
jgi:adenylate cyclase